jgi:hypothetical protein
MRIEIVLKGEDCAARSHHEKGSLYAIPRFIGLTAAISEKDVTTPVLVPNKYCLSIFGRKSAHCHSAPADGFYRTLRPSAGHVPRETAPACMGVA